MDAADLEHTGTPHLCEDHPRVKLPRNLADVRFDAADEMRFAFVQRRHQRTELLRERLRESLALLLIICVICGRLEEQPHERLRGGARGSDKVVWHDVGVLLDEARDRIADGVRKVNDTEMRHAL